MTPTTMELLKTAQQHDINLQKNGELDRPVSALADTGSTAPVTGTSKAAKRAASIPAGQEEANAKLSEAIQTVEHPFGNNDNNRLVAERVARDERRANGGKPVQLAKPLTAGEASERDLALADAYEEANPDSLEDNTVVEQHTADAQRQEILADRAAKVAAIAPTAGASAPAPPPLPIGADSGTDGAATELGQGTKTKPATAGKGKTTPATPPVPPATLQTDTGSGAAAPTGFAPGGAFAPPAIPGTETQQS